MSPMHCCAHGWRRPQCKLARTHRILLLEVIQLGGKVNVSLWRVQVPHIGQRGLVVGGNKLVIVRHQLHKGCRQLDVANLLLAVPVILPNQKPCQVVGVSQQVVGLSSLAPLREFGRKLG